MCGDASVFFVSCKKDVELPCFEQADAVADKAAVISCVGPYLREVWRLHRFGCGWAYLIA
jgi:hypothetical protein